MILVGRLRKEEAMLKATGALSRRIDCIIVNRCGRRTRCRGGSIIA